MVFGLIATAFLMTTEQPPLDRALSRTEPPLSMRAAFSVELTDGEALRRVRFDPRIQDDTERWITEVSTGKSAELDFAVAEWGKQKAPDGWLFPDDLRASMGLIVEAEEIGAAVRIHFRHQPSENDGPVDIWAAEHLAGFAWLEPLNAQFLRIDYRSFKPFNNPQGGRIESYSHSYLLGQDPDYGITYVSAFQVDVRGSFLANRFERAYRVQIRDVDFFFSSDEEESRFRERQKNLRISDERLIMSAQ